jgi:hypothetical protein
MQEALSHALSGPRSAATTADETEGTERSGSAAGVVQSEAARYIANKVTPPPVVGDIAGLVEQRNIRYGRRRQSATWVRDQAIRDAGQIPLGDESKVDGYRFLKASDPGWVRPPRVARCSWAVQPEIGLHFEHGSTAHFSGVERCGSIWACPVCAAVIRTERAQEIQTAVERHQEAGGSIVLVTLTLRHTIDDSLDTNIEALIGGWKRLLQGKVWASFKKRYGIIGFVRSVEVTYSTNNGWHPHIHALFFTEAKLSEKHETIFGDEIYGRWNRYVMERGAKSPSRRRGIDVQQVDSNGAVVAQYLGKLQDDAAKKDTSRWAVGQELARGDVKSGHNHAITPYQLLDYSTRSDDIDDLAARTLWNEYVSATTRRRAITWSRGLKKLYEIADLEDDVVMDEALDRVKRAWLTTSDEYERVRRSNPALLVAALEALETGNVALLRAILPGHVDANLDTSFVTLQPGELDTGRWGAIIDPDLPLETFIDLEALVLPF